jgi:N6-adenosine-specific RNA methylase IME4
MTWPFGHLTPGGYDVIIADPPWRFRHWNQDNQRKSASRYYRLMRTEDILALPVRELAAKNCILLLWATAPMLPQALATMEAWGFRYCSRTGWRKTYPSGAQATGTGYWVRTRHEDVLIGKIGKPKLARALPSLFDGIRRAHSQKPVEFYSMIADRTPGAARCELFSRQTHLGFTGWGDEVGKLDHPPLTPVEAPVSRKSAQFAALMEGLEL